MLDNASIVSGSGFRYDLVPEPGALTLLVMTSLFTAIGRRGHLEGRWVRIAATPSRSTAPNSGARVVSAAC